jgi:Asp-tRNA(Asn)/Glu-tRNA(Gln) amidotransferase A subunit family amidase
LSKRLDECLKAYADWEPQLHAFAWCDPELVRREAQRIAARAGASGLPLAGLPVGVKDIFDTAGIPTEYGSPVFAGRIPKRSAEAVRRLRRAGALIFGKTVTAELAYYAPGPTTNPWNPARTPGGSSMGSAAAVAAGVLPAAIGTQTNGSVIRPAAFCGVVGFKPTAGRIPRSGVLRFSPSLDQVGVFARDVQTASRLTAVLAGASFSRASGGPPNLGIVRTPEWSESDVAAQRTLEAAVDAAVAGGATRQEVELPRELADALGVHRTIMAAEAARWIGPLVADQRDRCSPQLNALLEEGAAVPPGKYAEARRAQKRLTADFKRWVRGFDALLTLPTLGEAPPLATTGDPRCCTRWTLVGAPAFTLPAAFGPNRLPLGVQLVGHLGEDAELINMAEWLEARLPKPGLPPRPGSDTTPRSA